LIIGICGIDFPFTTINSLLSAIILGHENGTALASLSYLTKWVQSTFHYIITRYMHMLVASGVKKKVSKAKQNILCLCIFLSASLFYVVGMAYKKAYRLTNRLIDQVVGSPWDELKLYLESGPEPTDNIIGWWGCQMDSRYQTLQ
jgi:hypothetical protein